MQTQCRPSPNKIESVNNTGGLAPPSCTAKWPLSLGSLVPQIMGVKVFRAFPATCNRIGWLKWQSSNKITKASCKPTKYHKQMSYESKCLCWRACSKPYGGLFSNPFQENQLVSSIQRTMRASGFKWLMSTLTACTKQMDYAAPRRCLH